MEVYFSKLHMWVCFLDGVQSLHKTCRDAESAERSNEQEQHNDSEISALYCGCQVPAITTGASRQDGEVLNTQAHIEIYSTPAFMYLCFFLLIISFIYSVKNPVF